VLAGDDGAEAPVGFPEHLAALAELVRAKHARLVIIDPLMAYLDPSVGAHRDQSVRRALLPLKELAQQTGCAVVLVRHLHKAPGRSASYRGGGSIGIIGAARSGLLATADPVDPDRRLLAPVKSNLAARVPTLAYTVSGEPPTITWLGPVAMTADTLVGAGADADSRTTQTAAAGVWLTEALAGGPREARALIEEAEAAGHSANVLRRAAETGHIAKVKHGFGRDSFWLWSLPQDP
ncbi:MAG: AAA family ATPase, partial [Chloroflexi bacterium]|nr:AAA family ATPase [Chloroflexota bacterium]